MAFVLKPGKQKNHPTSGEECSRQMRCVWVPEIRPSSEASRNQEKACVGRRSQRETVAIHVSGAGETEERRLAVL